MQKNGLKPHDSEAEEESTRVLLVEDNIVSRKLLEKILIKGGFEVITAENGRKALSLFKKQFCPIVLTDWVMPEMNGLELCQAIRNHQSPGYVFIVIITAKDTKDDIISGLESGADDYLTKPINQSELFARLKTGKRILQLERSLKKANEEIRLLSITDSLTKVYNRGYLNESLPHEIKRSSRFGRSLSIIMCDLDHFKQINDGYGHEAGDLVLREFASSIKTSIRDAVDWVIRVGGEEFMIVLPETGLDGAHAAAERLRKVVSELDLCYNGHQIHVTASFGVASYHPSRHIGMITPEILMKQADEWLYRAKREGRNLVRSSLSLSYH